MIGPKFTYRRRYVLTGKPDCMRPATPPDKVARILEMGRAGELLKNIASEVGVSIGCASDMLRANGLGRRGNQPSANLLTARTR